MFQYLNFHSYCSLKRKRNLICTLCDRAVKICSDQCLQPQLENISSILQGNGYPKELIENTIQKRLDKRNKDKQFGPKLHCIPLKLPFLGEKSHAMEKNLNSAVRTCYFSATARIIFTSRPNFTAANKDPIPTFNKSMVVYQFNCHCDSDYIGQTSRRFNERLKEHVPKCVRMFLNNSSNDYKNSKTLTNAAKKSSIAKHLLENKDSCGKNYNNSMFKIIRSCRTLYQLRVTEAVLISTFEPNLCIQQDFDYATVLV